MRRSVLTRRMTVTMRNGVEISVEAVRFLSLTRRELGVIRYAVTPLHRAAEITFSPYIDADVRNADANYDEKFWEPVATDADVTQSRTRKSGFRGRMGAGRGARRRGVPLRDAAEKSLSYRRGALRGGPHGHII